MVLVLHSTLLRKREKPKRFSLSNSLKVILPQINKILWQRRQGCTCRGGVHHCRLCVAALPSDPSSTQPSVPPSTPLSPLFRPSPTSLACICAATLCLQTIKNIVIPMNIINSYLGCIFNPLQLTDNSKSWLPKFWNLIPNSLMEGSQSWKVEAKFWIPFWSNPSAIKTAPCFLTSLPPPSL